MKFIIPIAALFIGFSPVLFGAVTFTNTPAVVSNTYSGFITLQIGGIPTGDTVVVQKFLDLNASGTLNSADPLVQQFRLTDGQPGQVIGGVTNYNVPGDLNVVTGAVTAALNFQNGDISQNLVGQYLYKISSPVGHFKPITNSFVVTNFPFAQRFTGIVVSNNTATRLSNPFIFLFRPSRAGNSDLGKPVAGTVADPYGAYSIAMPAGVYRLVAFQTNYVTSIANSPVLALGSCQTVTANLSLTNSTGSVTATLVDATNSAIKIPGVFMPLEGTNGLFAFGFSDTNGVVRARVRTGPWTVGTDDSGLIIHGYVGYNSGSNVNSGGTITLPFQRANALFYGSVADDFGNPLAVVDITASDIISNRYQMDGFTDANGNYFVGALGLGANDPWQIRASGQGSVTLGSYVFSVPPADQNDGTNLTSGSVVLQDFTALSATNTISGSVIDTTNNPIINVLVFTYANINGLLFEDSETTDTNGMYAHDVANGTWTVNVLCGGGSNSLPPIYECPNAVVVPIVNNSVVTNFIVFSCGGVTIDTTSPLPLGVTNHFYSQTLEASSCNPPVTWTTTAGAPPPGLILASTGNLTGVPTTAGVFNFTVMAADNKRKSTTKSFSLTISNGVQITTTSLPNGTNGLDYSQQLHAVNGIAPFFWSLFSGSLPTNLSLSVGGLISGNAATGGTFGFIVQVTDSFGVSIGQPLSITLLNTNIPPLAMSTDGEQIHVLWPATAGTNFTLQTSTNVDGPWGPATNGALQNAYAFTNSGPTVFFRLQ